MAESTVIFGPMSQVGWARASATVHLGKLFGREGAEWPPAGGQYHPPHLLPPPGLQGLKHGAVFAVDGQDSWRFFAVPARVTSGPPTTRLSLLAKATVLPASKAAQVPRRPALPTMAETTMSTSGVGGQPGDSLGPDEQFDAGRQCRPILPAGRRRVGHHDLARAGQPGPAAAAGRCCCGPKAPPPAVVPPEAAITSSVLRPMLPVEPNTATLVTRSVTAMGSPECNPHTPCAGPPAHGVWRARACPRHCSAHGVCGLQGPADCKGVIVGAVPRHGNPVAGGRYSALAITNSPLKMPFSPRNWAAIFCSSVRRTAQHDHLQAEIVRQMGVQRRNHQVVVVVLHFIRWSRSCGRWWS